MIRRVLRRDALVFASKSQAVSYSNDSAAPINFFKRDCLTGRYRTLDLDRVSSPSEERLRQLEEEVAHLREREALLSDFVEQANVALHWVGSDGTILWANAAELALLGYSKDEYIGRNIKEFHADDGTIADILARLKANESLHNYEARLRTRTGSIKHVLINSSVLWKEGEFVHTRCFTRDVTQRVRAEAQFREAAEHYKVIIATAPDAVISIDEHSTIVAWNPQAEATFGWSSEEAIGARLDMILPERYRAAHHRGLEHYLATGEGPVLGKRVTLSGVRKNGDEFPVELAISPIRKGDGWLFTAFLRDISASVEQQARLRESETRLRLALETAQIGVWEWDIGTHTVHWSDRVYEIHGLPPGSLSGRPEEIAELFHPQDRDAVRDKVLGAVQDTGSYNIEFRIVRPDGEIRWIATSGVVLNDGAKAPRVLGTTIDTTDRHSVEDALRSHAAALARSNADLEQFAFAASHDLQEPLRNIAMYTQLLARKYDGSTDPDTRELVKTILNGTERSSALLQDLLAYTQAANLDVIDPTPTSASAALELALKQIGTEGATITFAEMPQVRVFPVHLVQIFQNLLSNGLKYRNPAVPPEIHVDVAREGDWWRFAVRDNGIGIKPEYHKQIFGMFKRLHTSNEYPGTGVGLALVKKIVERYGGKIWVVSQPGEGSTFYFTLPVS